jgi:4-carboxymuconolactone decarboxylase
VADTVVSTWQAAAMRLDSPRIPPVSDGDASPRQAAQLAGVTRPGSAPLNVFRTLAHVPDALDAFLAWGGFMLSKKNPLPPRERELVILRVGLLCGSGYEWTQHVPIGKRAGLTTEEIERLKLGPDADGWSPLDAALVRAADELVGDHFVTDATWSALAAELSPEQCMAVVMTVGQYTQVSMMLNTFGVQLDEGQTLDPDLRR